MTNTLFTIGHSNQSLAEFMELLAANGVTAIADVRSQPSSGRYPHFNGDVLKEHLRGAGVDYVFLGRELGARRQERDCYVDGRVRYERIVRSDVFLRGLERLRRGGVRYRIALMCAEKEPLDCHRTILICRALSREFDIRHIIGPNEVESHEDCEERLLDRHHLTSRDLFRDPEEVLDDAYALQAKQIEYTASVPSRSLQPAS